MLGDPQSTDYPTRKSFVKAQSSKADAGGKRLVGVVLRARGVQVRALASSGWAIWGDG